MQQDFKTFFETSNIASISQYLHKTPELFFEKNGFPELKYLIGDSYKETKVNIYEYMYGSSSCEFCGEKVKRLLPGWNRGWCKTCSEECRQKLASERQQGEKNTSHKMSEETKNAMKQKVSCALKAKIKDGSFTPKFLNYKNQRPIKYFSGDEIKQTRSLWELIFILNFPEYEYETKRFYYYDTIKQSKRVYIPDFYDKDSNTIIEIRPKAYQHLLKDKREAVIQEGYNYKIIDEDYFNTQKTIEMISKIESIVCDINDVKSRLKWLRKV